MTVTETMSAEAFVLPASGWVRVSGSDSTKFLDSLISQAVSQTKPGDVAFGLLLEPQGKMGFSIDLLRVGDDEWLIGSDVGLGEALAAAFKRFLIRVDVVVAELSSGVIVEVLGQSAERVVAQLAGGVPEAGRLIASASTADDIVAWYRADWGLPRFVGVFAGADGEATANAALTANEVSVSGLVRREVARVAAGVPGAGSELDGVIPQEAGIVERRVSFTKGCFIGQELVCRIDSRGRVNRHLARFESGSPIEPGAEIVWDGNVVGVVTSGAATQAGWVGLGYLRREVDVPGTVEIAGSPADVVGLSTGF